jgi:fructose transport system ATP-binding protein
MAEPAAAPGLQETVRGESIMRDLKKRGIPMILISHSQRYVFDILDRLVIFRRGRIVVSLRKDETDGVSYVAAAKGGRDADCA